MLAAAGTDIPLSLRFYYMKFYLPFIKYEEEGEAIIDNINAFPATEREELSALTDAQKNMMRQPFLGPYLFNWNNNAREALELGANAICLSHIFATDCKAGLAPKGLNLIRAVREFFAGEIYALGGITPHNFASVLRAGADRIAVMSPAMAARDASDFIRKFKK